MNLLGIPMYKKVVGLLLILTMSCVVYAYSAKETEDSTSTSSAPVNTQVNKQSITDFIQANTRLSVIDIKPSALPGVAEVATDQGLFYASNDGEFFIAGKIYRSSGGFGLVDIGEQRYAQERLAGVKAFENNMIVYPAKNEKHVITVFTDITCGYCRKMHAQMSAYNDLGITIRYLAYPRHGVRDQSGQLTQSFQDLRSIWCHESPAEALTKAKAGSQVAHRICDAPIEEEFNFGRQIGVNGTPAVILSNGQLLPGYREPDDLIKILAEI
ncbi:bifunctional protein-disulfide isomerase/oxidoreductase DsbC [Thalassotalea agariperforans]